jgi:hypothetical protein
MFIAPLAQTDIDMFALDEEELDAEKREKLLLGLWNLTSPLD